MKRPKLILILIAALWACFAMSSIMLIVQISTKPSGSVGPQGTQGVQGDPGERGSLWFSGSGAPTASNPSNPKSGDFYIDLDSMNIYKYNGTAWVASGSLKGEDGNSGEDGNDGNRGSIWFRGTAEPANGTTADDVKEGDFYFLYFEDTSLLNGYRIYRYSDERWNLLVDLATARNISEASEFSVKTSTEFEAIAKLVNEGETFQGKTITLADDIDLNGDEWVPIGSKAGSSAASIPFSGTFDGNNKTISNMTIYSSGKTEDGEGDVPIKYYAGFFGALKNATVKDLTISGASVGVSPQYESGTRNVAPQYSGVFAGRIDGGTVSNVRIVDSNVRVSQHGGIFAAEAWTGKIIDCEIIGSTMTGSTGAFIGGFSGQGYATYENCTVDGCTIQGGMKTGGIVGQFDEGSGGMKNVTVKNTTIQLMTNYAGGMLVGLLNYGSRLFEDCKVENCTISEERNQKTSMYDVGGFIGKIIGRNGNVVTFKNCQVDGITFKNYVSVKNVGGFVGGQQSSENYKFTLSFEGCSVSGLRVTSDSDEITYVGAFVGRLDGVGANLTISFEGNDNYYSDCGDYELVGDSTHVVSGAENVTKKS